MLDTLTVTVVSLNGQHAELSVAGEVDMNTEDQLRSALVDLIGKGAKNLVVDMAGVTFLDSSGLRGLLEVVRLGAHLTLRHMVPAVRMVFDIVTIPSLTIED